MTKTNKLLPLHNVQYKKNPYWTSNTEKIRLPVVQYRKNNNFRDYEICIDTEHFPSEILLCSCSI
jgi:hypothetical protein